MRAKTAPPQLRAADLRPEQLARVTDAAKAPLLLVHAPAGYGKTTLVAAAAAELGWQCVWYRLDRLDADPESFLRSLVCAVRLGFPSLSKTQFDEARREAVKEKAAIANLVSELGEELAHVGVGPKYIILDDYDAVEPQGRFDAAISAILRLLPPTVHLAVLCRRRPAFATAKLELEGGLGEISYRDLLLDQGQTARAFERLSGAAPTPAVLEELRELTEGWAAGVVLAGKAAGQAAPEAPWQSLDELAVERAVLPYLADEVYEGLPVELREFLKRTCFLEAVTAALAEAVSASPDAQRLLEHLLTHELFTFAGPSGMTRYHPLFRRFLGRQLIREEGADAHRALQRRSADALAEHGHFVAALDLYLALGELQTTLTLLQRRGTELIDECGDGLLQRWVDALRSASATDSSWTPLVEGRRLFRRGHLASAREQLESALSTLSEEASGRYLAHRALARHCYLTNLDEEAVEYARTALKAATDRRQEAESLVMLAQTLSSTCRWQELDETMATLGALVDAPPRVTAEVAYLEVQRAHMTGDVRQALFAAEKALPLARRHASREEAGNLLNGIARLNLFLGHYGRATQHLTEAKKECAAHRLHRTAAAAQLTDAALLAQAGKSDAALALLDQVAAERHARDNAALQYEVEALRGDTLRRAGCLDGAEQAYDHAIRIIASSDGPPYDRLSTRLDLAFTVHLRGSHLKAATQIQHLMDEAARLQFLFLYAKARLYLGVISAGSDGPSPGDLGSPCEELLRLGHLDFLGQELAASMRAARALTANDIDEAPLLEVFGAIACQTKGPEVLSSLAQVSDRVGLLAVEAAHRHMPMDGCSRMLAELRRHRSRRVRDRARRLLIADNRGRLFPELTPREEEILALLAEGSTNQQIAEQLLLTLATVKTHVHRILTKTGACGRLAAAVAYKRRAAEKAGLRDRRALT